MKKFWRLENSVDGNGSTIYIDGAISSEEWWGDEATPQQLREALKGISDSKVTVVINSGGGDVWAGLAMYNALRELKAEVTVRVDGLAASIASVIAMAGDKIIMSPGSMMMIHKASAWAGGNADDLTKIIEMLETVEESIVPIYADRTKLSREEVQDMMNAETWMSAEEAVELGFADEVATNKIEETVNNTFSREMVLSMSATKESIKKAMALKNESDQAEDPAKPEEEAPSDDPDPTPSTAKVDKPTDEAESDDEAKEVKEEVKTDEPEVEPVATTEVKPTATKKETKMSKEIAQDQVIEPTNQAPVTPKVDSKTYLKTPASMDAFAKILEKHAGETSEDVKNAWKEHLEVTLGVTNPDVFLPEALITQIEDAFKQGGEIWNRVSKTGADVFRSAWDAEDDVSSNDGRGRGYNRADAEDKAEQVLTFADRVLRPQFVYKYITLNREDVKNQRSTGALVAYVLSELPRRIIREVERAIVIGDGRADGDDYKIQEGNPEGFYNIKGDADADNGFATTYTPVADESRYSTLIRAGDLVESEGARVLIAKKGYTTEMLLESNANGGFLFAPGTNLAGVLGFETVIEPDWLTDTTDPENDAYIVVLSNYKTVGDASIESFTNFTLKQNKQEYLQEIWAGGGLTVRKSAVAIAATASS